jgi:hypothetical protein
MKFVFGIGESVFNGKHWVTEKREWEVSDEAEIKKYLASGWFSRFKDDGEYPKYHVIQRTPRDQYSEDFYNQLLRLGAEGYELFYVDTQRIFFIKRK